MALTEEELQRLRDAAAGYEPEQEKPERFESGRDSADGGGLDNPITATLVRGAQSVGMPLYNYLYDQVAGAVGGTGIDMETESPDIRIGEDGEFETRPVLVRGTPPLLGGKPQERPGFGGGRPSTSIIPTRNYYKLEDDGSYKLVERDAPLPFIGRVDRVDTGNDLLNTGTDVLASMAQLIFLVRGGRGSLANQAPSNIQRLASAANQPKPLSKAGLEKAGAVFKKGLIEYGQAGLVQSFINAGADPGSNTTASAVASAVAEIPAIKNNVSKEAIDTVLNPLTINPEDPLAVRQIKAIADEVMFNIPLGGAMELGFYGLNQIRKSGARTPAFAAELHASTKEVLQKSLQFMRAQVLGEVNNAAPQVVTDPQVTVVNAAERRARRAASDKLAEQRKIEQLRDEEGFQRPEQFEQPQLRPLTPEEVANIQQRAQSELQVAAEKHETLIAKAEVASSPGVSDLPTARPELQTPSYEQVATLPRQQIFAAPKALQYKAAGLVTKSGASGVLSDAARYNPNLAGTILAWRDAAGEIDPANPGRVYAVDGHNRLDLANRLGYEGGVNVQFIDAPDVATARTIGAMSNIANRNGTPTDAAKVLRDTGMSIEEMASMGVAPSGSVARVAIGLRDLPQDLFDKVVAGDVSEEIGSAIGKGGLPDQVQRDILGVATKKKWGVERVREAVALGNEATVTTEIDTGVLPGLGLEELTSSDFQKLLDIRIHVRGLLKTKIRALGAVTDTGKANTLVDAGNVLDVEQSKTAREQTIIGERVFNQMAGMTGPLNDLLKEMAGQVRQGKGAAAVARENSERIGQVLDSYVTRDLIPRQAQAKAAQLQAEQAAVDGQPTPEAPNTGAPAGGTLNQMQVARLQGLDAAGREAERVKLKKMVLGAKAKANREAKLAQLQAQDAKNLEYLDDIEAMEDGELSVEDFEAKYGAGSATSEEPAVFASKPGEYTKVKRALDRDEYARLALEILDGAETQPAVATRKTATADEIRRNITDIINKARADLPQDKRDELIEQLISERLTKGAIVSNPSEIGGRTIPQLPDAELPEPPRPQVIEYDDVDQLPKRLKGARASAANTELLFESDVDRAIFIATSKNPSKRRDDFLEWLNSIGIPEETIQGTGIQIREHLKQARLYNNPNAPKKLHLKDFGAQNTSGSLSGEIDFGPNPGGRIGEDLTDELRISQADQVDLLMQVQEIAGPVNVEFRDEMNFAMDAAQAKSYGVPTGTNIRAAGLYHTDPYDPAGDVIYLAEGSGGRVYEFSLRRQVAFHEAFHRIQQRYLTEAERKILQDALPELRQLAAKYNAAMRQNILNGRMSPIEVQAVAFQAMAEDPGLVTKKVTWAKPLQKLLDIAARVNNWLKGRGYRTWNDVFESAASGEMAATREPAAFQTDMLAAYAVPEIDPEEAAKKFSARRKEGDERIQAGDIEIDEALANEVRRGISRSGKTRYIEHTQEELASAYYALRRVMNENMADLTGIPEFKESDLARAALDHIKRFDGPQEVLEGIQRMLDAGSPESGQHVVALTALQMMRDNAQNAARLRSIEYENAVEPDFKAEQLKALVVSYSEMTQLDRQYRRMMRMAGQMLRVGKNKPADGALDMQLPAGQKLRVNGSAERVESVLGNGFTEETVTPGLMGDGIYMTTDASTSMDWGDSQAVGSLTSDVKIMDLYSSNKRIQDLLRELALGAPLADGKGIKLTDEQIEAIRDYAMQAGFDGIRYEGNYKPGQNPYDEVVIFNKDVADRVIDSDVATDPEAGDATNAIGAGVDGVLREPMQPMTELLDENLLAKIQDGVDDAETQEVGAMFSQLVREEPAVQIHMAELLEKGGKGSVNRNYLFEAYRGAILFSGQTWWKMGLGSAYRTLTAPIAEGAGHLTIGAAQKLRGQDVQAYLSMRRASLAPLQMQQYLLNVPNAFRMALTAFKENRSFGRAGFTGGTDFDEAMQESFQMRTTNSGTRIMQEVDFSNPNKGNMVSHLNHALGVASARDVYDKTGKAALSVLGQGGRVAAGIDTFFNYMVGPAQNLTHNLDEMLTAAETQHGLKGQKAFDWAMTEALAKTKRQFVDVHLANGTVVKDGAITGSAADDILNFIQFSDKLRLSRSDIAERTYTRGVAIAREEGLTQAAEIHARAMQHMEDVPEWAVKLTQTLNIPSRAVNEIHHNVIGKWLTPIMKTPVNIVKSGARAFGFGVFVDTWWKDMLSENPATRARAIGEIAVGWGTFVLINQLIDGGVIETTGANPASYQRSQLNEIVRSPGFSIRVNTPDGPTDWHSVQAFDTLTTALAIVGRVRSDADLLTEQQVEEQMNGAVLLLAQVARAVSLDALTRDVFGGLDELMTTLQMIQGNENDDGMDLAERLDRGASYILPRKVSSFVPAFLRNLQNDATEMRFRADRDGYTPDGPLGYVMKLLEQMRSNVEVQLPGVNQQPVVLDPITGFALHKTSSADTYLEALEANRWLKAAVQQGMPHAAFKSVKGADYMPVHTEFNLLQQHHPTPIVFYTRTNLSTKRPDGRVINLNKLTSRGLQVTHNDTNEIIALGATLKINGKTMEQALAERIASRQYQALSPRRSGIRGEEQKSERLVELYAIVKQYRERAVGMWLETTPRGNEFLQAHEEKVAADNEQDFIDDQRRAVEREVAEALRPVIERDEAIASAPQGSGRLTQEVGNFIQAVGT